MLACRTRCLTRILGQFSNRKQPLCKQKVEQICKKNVRSLSVASSRQAQISSVGAARWACRRHQNARTFHATTICCGDQIVNCPAFAESISEGDIRWEKAVGDSFDADDVLAEIETDKTSVPVNAPMAGVLVEIFFADGDTVESGARLCRISSSGAAAEVPASAPAPLPTEAAAPPPPLPPPPPPPASSAAGPIPTTPPPVPPLPTQPMTSVPKSDIKPRPAAPPPPSMGAVSTGSMRSESRVKMNRMRQRIAQRLKDAQNTCAMLTTFNEIDMSNTIEMRNLHKDKFLKQHGLKLGFMSAFVKASAAALVAQPVVNAVIDDLDMVYRDYVDISVAVATPKGLVVPVIRNVESMNYADIEKSIHALGEKARDGDLAIEDMDGGTFTISNGGVFGSMFGTPILNPPQSAILGMHGIFDRPVAVKGKVEIRPMMYVALTYDHRLVDGREAVTFLRKIKAAVEDPRVLLLDI